MSCDDGWIFCREADVGNVAMMEADQNGDGKLDFEEFKAMVANTDIAKQMVRSPVLSFDAQTNVLPSPDSRGYDPSPACPCLPETDSPPSQICGSSGSIFSLLATGIPVPAALPPTRTSPRNATLSIFRPGSQHCLLAFDFSSAWFDC